MGQKQNHHEVVRCCNNVNNRCHHQVGDGNERNNVNMGNRGDQPL